ncbi:MAG: glutathione S-transferase family protein [Rickettsiaceae bacterium]|nr:glutathione S-transferase family protein [Rickettsiaceae bacterium]
MGLLVEGKWVDQWYDTKSTNGKFKRQESSFRDFIGSNKFPAEVGRYHLYISYACPWAHRAAIFRKLKGLEKIIPLTVVDAHMGENGWEMNNDPDPVNGKKYMHQIYTLANPKYTGRVTVPVLWDKTAKTIVNNESSEIIRMFNSEFNHITGNEDDYYPSNLSQEIDKVNNFVYDTINNGVYKAGFATKQEVYEDEVKKLFAALDEIEKRLSKQRYLVGNKITEADWRIFTTLLRFDPVYVGHFKCNIRRIRDYPNIDNYTRDLYQVSGVKDTVNMQHIKTHYYTSHKAINPNRIIPFGPYIDYDAKHDRNRFN